MWMRRANEEHCVAAATKFQVEQDMDPAKLSNSDLIARAVSGLWNWSKAGFATVDDHVFQRRVAACLSCPNIMVAPKRVAYRAATNGDADARMCVLCGCIVAHKARLASETCPDRDSNNPEVNRWSERLVHRFPERSISNE
jgi:hypothetical protein